MPTIELKGIRKSFGKELVLDDISISVDDGEFCVLLGPSGCGKSTLLRILAGLERHDRGAILFDDDEVGHLSPRQRDVAMVFQSYALYPHLSVFDNLAFPLKARRQSRQEIERKVKRAAALLDIEALLDRKPRALSGGQQQRVAIGRAIVREPKVFLFDEPLSNLDAGLRSEMRRELANLHRELDATIVYVTHDQVEAMTLGQKVVLLDQGRIQQLGPPENLYLRPANLCVAGFIGSPSMNLIEGRLEGDGHQLVFRTPDFELNLGDDSVPPDLIGAAVTLGVRPESITPGGGDLEGRVDYVEDLGGEVLAYVNLGQTQVICKAPGGWRYDSGEPVTLSVDRSSLHVFHDNRRIGGGPTA